MAGVDAAAGADALSAARAAVAALDGRLGEVGRLLSIADPDGWVV
jgi:hypothetical protein